MQALMQLEAEENRRREAEKLAFDEGRRRRKVEEELRQRAEELSVAQAALTAATELGDRRVASTLEVSATRHALASAFAAWRVNASSRRTDAAEQKAARCAAQLAETGQLLATAAAERDAQADASQRLSDELNSKLRAASREASEAHLSVLSARQQRAEALARAAAEEQGRLEAEAETAALHERRSALLDRLATAAARSRPQGVGPRFCTWSRVAAGRRGKGLGAAEAERAAAEGVAASQQRAEASARDAAAHAADAAAARADGERALAQSELRLRRAEAARKRDEARERIERGVLLRGELSGVEALLSRATLVTARCGKHVGVVRSAQRDTVALRGVLAAWGGVARRASLERVHQRADAAAAEAAAARARAEQRRLEGEAARRHCAMLMGARCDRDEATCAFQGWRSVVHAAKRAEDAACEAAKAEEARQLQRQLEAAADAARTEAALLEERLKASDAALTNEREGRRAVETEVAELRAKLEASERAALREAARAQKSEDAQAAMEEELRAAQYKMLLEEEAASKQAEDIHMQLSDIMPKSPYPRGRAARGFPAAEQEEEEETADE